jgi:hypothetical protein
MHWSSITPPTPLAANNSSSSPRDKTKKGREGKRQKREGRDRSGKVWKTLTLRSRPPLEFKPLGSCKHNHNLQNWHMPLGATKKQANHLHYQC